MVFSSLEFIFLFLPLTICLYYASVRFISVKLATIVLFLSSLFYYAYWNPYYLWIILASVFFNYSIGYAIQFLSIPSKNYQISKSLAQCFSQKCVRVTYLLGITANIALLLYYKYTNFLFSNFSSLMEWEFNAFDIVMPIGISFFTFQQIAYLSDIYLKKHNPIGEGFINYCLFVCFFPQLVAGPIVHHKEMMPQFALEKNKRFNWQNIYWGLVLFTIGLAKKVLIADTISPFVHNVFDLREALSFLEALIASLAYTFQLYFDFSGYSDMAVACALFFNIKLPFNFDSPYKAYNIQDFWRKWHITLSRWLREYVYIPLGGNKKGKERTYINLFLTFLIGGIWHGAAWTFIIWGALHGIAIALHRVWQKSGRQMAKIPAIILTFFFVNFAWIFFRAPNFERLKIFFDAFTFEHGFSFLDKFSRTYNAATIPTLIVALLLIFVAKNSKQLYERNRASACLTISSSLLFGIIILILFFKSLDPSLPQGEFIYFQF